MIFAARPGPAQEFGQWWWEGQVSGVRHDSKRLIDGEQISRFGQTDLKLSLDLNGFFGHPAIGSFRLGLDLLRSSFSGGRSLDIERPGFRSNFWLFPAGRYPISFHFSRYQSDYSGEEPDSPYSPLGLAETTTAWGARVRLKGGPLRGAQIGFEHSASGYLDPAAKDEVQDLQFADWSRRGNKLRHHARLERSFRTFGFANFEIEDLTLTIDEQGELTDKWRWEMAGVGVRRSLHLLDGRRTESDFFRLRNRLARRMRGDDLLDFHAVQSLTRASAGGSAHSYGITGFYRWHPRQRLEIAPFVELWQQSVGDTSAWSPRAGVTASLSTDYRAISTVLNGTMSYGVLKSKSASDDPDGDEDRSNLAFSLSCSLMHGTTLAKELELEFGRHEAHSTATPNLDLPDLGLSSSGIGTEDYYRLRLTLRRRWGTYSGSVWGDWSHRQSAGSLGLSEHESETYSATAQIGLPSLNFQASAGRTAVQQADPGNQDLEYLSASLSWRPSHMVSLRGIYRQDRRQLALVSDLDGQQITAQLQVKVGLLAFSARAYQSRQRIGQGPEQASNGLTLTISRNFSGRLPIVTGSSRRGEVL